MTYDPRRTSPKAAAILHAAARNIRALASGVGFGRKQPHPYDHDQSQQHQHWHYHVSGRALNHKFESHDLHSEPQTIKP